MGLATDVIRKVAKPAKVNLNFFYNQLVIE
jgi:hypothetical protein